MAEEISNEKKEKNAPVSIHKAHGQEQQIKMDVLDMVNRAEDPFAIIYHLVKWLGEFSGEPSYAKYGPDPRGLRPRPAACQAHAGRTR